MSRPTSWKSPNTGKKILADGVAIGEAADGPALRREARDLVREKIAELPEIYRIALTLRDIEGLANDELAEVLGVTVNAAKIRVHRARQALRTLLDPYMREGSR